MYAVIAALCRKQAYVKPCPNQLFFSYFLFQFLPDNPEFKVRLRGNSTSLALWR